MEYAFISGSSQRIGGYLSEFFAKSGYNIVIHYFNSKTEAIELADNLRNKYSVNTYTIGCDFKDEDAIEAMMNELQSNNINLDILINNASCFLRDSLEDSPKEIWNENFQVNVRAPFLLASYFVKQLAKNKQANIINVLDNKLARPYPAYISYTLAKYSLLQLTKLMAESYAPFVRVNAVAPGATIMGKNDTQESFARIVNKSLLKQQTSMQDIAKTIEMFLNVNSITGEIVYL